MPYDERDEQSGRFTPEFADKEFLEAVRDGATTSEVADAVGCKYRTAYERLQRLEETGRVSARKIGKTYLWETDEDEAAAEPAESQDRREPPERLEETPKFSPGDVSAETLDDSEAATHGELEAAVREWLEDHPPKKAHGKRAAIEAWRYLRDHGTTTTADVQKAVYPVVEEHYSGARTMWNSIGRYLDAVPGLEKPGYGEWGYAGDAQAWAELSGDESDV